MKKKNLGTGNSLSLVFTICLALFNLGIFGLILLSGNEINRTIRENFEVQVFLDKGISGEEMTNLETYFQQAPFVAKTGIRSQYSFVSKEEAGRRFMEETGEDFSQFLGENPLRDAFSLKINQAYLSSGGLSKIKSQLVRQKGVFEVVYIESLIDSIQDNLNKVSLMFLSVAAMLLLTSTWLIRNTIKLSIFSQRFLIRTMELVGAEPWFIQRPYILSMLIRGFIGGGIAVILILFSIQGAQTYVPQLKPLLIPEKILILLTALPIFGCGIGVLSAWLSVRKYQGRKLDELHNFQ